MRVCSFACGGPQAEEPAGFRARFLDDGLPALRAAVEDARWCRPQWALPGVAQGAGFDAVTELGAGGAGELAGWARALEAEGAGVIAVRVSRARNPHAGLSERAMASELGFDPKTLLDEAQRRAGSSDFGDPAFHEPMQRLLHALEREAELHEQGRLGQLERIVGLLVNRLRTEEHVRRHPEILEQRIRAPIVIVGLARTGTTMLHRMLASDPRLHALLWYESRQPAPHPGAEASAPDPRIADAEREVEAMLGASPDLIAAHPMDALAPDEEIMLVEHAFLSTNPEAFCRIPSFAAWREAQDLTPGYAYLDRLLRFLQWQKRRRGEAGERWILKTPFHLGHMDALFRAFPTRASCGRTASRPSAFRRSRA